MTNTELNSNGAGIAGAASPAYNKQIPNAPKKTALRDVQNENAGSLHHKQQEGLLFGGTGRSTGDAIKVCGTKRLTPERPATFPNMAAHGALENVMNARRRFELELGGGRLQNNVEKYSEIFQSRNAFQLPQEKPPKPSQTKDANANVTQQVNVAATSQMTPIMSFSSGGPSVPSFSSKVNSTIQPIPLDSVKVSPKSPHTGDSRRNGDQMRMERYARLQEVLKQCDEADRRGYTQMLLNSSPAELSKHAVDLEKRAIQLILEEGTEMRRMKELNILGKSVLTNTPVQPTQSTESTKG